MDAMRGTVHQSGEAMPIAAGVEVAHGCVIARAEDGREWSVALDRASIEPGGFDGDMVFCREGTLTIAVSDARFAEALARQGGERVAEALSRIASHRRRHTRGRWIGVGVVVAVLAIVAGLVMAVPRMLAASTVELPVSIDRQLGDAAFAQAELSGAPVHEPAVTSAISAIVERLAPFAAKRGFDFRVRVIERDEVNAFALPGGQIVVFTGLIRRAESADQVAGVLAHEMSHVTLRHGLRNVAHRAGLMLALQILLGDASGWARLAGDAAVLAQSNDYSREQESAADAEGVRMMMAAGLDPEGMASFFRLLEDEPGGAIPAWMSTHPDLGDRVAHVHALEQTLPSAPRRPLEVDWAAAKRAVSVPR
jgi:predicted Zn-dependent protease